MNWKNITGHLPTTVVGLLAAIVIGAPIIASADWNHVSVKSVCGVLVAVALALLGAFAPNWKAMLTVGLKPGTTSGVFLLTLLMPAMVAAQQPVANPPVAASTDITNLYAAGVSLNSSATPAIAGTGLYAHKIADTGTYAFTAIDALPNTLKPFTVTTNIGAGVAQKLVTIGKVPIFIPTAAGISFNGTNTGWQWNTGAMASIKLKGNYYLLPTVRLVKSSVSNGSGYQPIVGVLFGWGQ